MSRLLYLITHWGNTNDTTVTKAQRTQNYAARFVTGQRRTTSSKKLLKECGWLSIREHTEYYSITGT